jgi:hypothetical protein
VITEEAVRFDGSRFWRFRMWHPDVEGTAWTTEEQFRVVHQPNGWRIDPGPAPWWWGASEDAWRELGYWLEAPEPPEPERVLPWIY